MTESIFVEEVESHKSLALACWYPIFHVYLLLVFVCYHRYPPSVNPGSSPRAKEKKTYTQIEIMVKIKQQANIQTVPTSYH